jgi:mannose-1-phosphate guanylyltransferase/mannose-6-phosphate isomerase
MAERLRLDRLAGPRAFEKPAPDEEAHALILAGGEGSRLRALTRRLSGEDLPKQFAELLGDISLLEQTRRRAAKWIRKDRTQILLTRAHERFFRPLLEDAPASALAVQPSNRGTAVAVLYGLLRAAHRGSDAPIVILPCDHWVSDESAFMAHVAAALGLAQAQADAIVLLGIPATRAESQYGWIEPGPPVFDGWPELKRVRSFVEKPAPEEAAAMASRGMLWNSFVVVGRISRFLLLFALTVPDLVDAFVPLWRAFDSAGEPAALDRLYEKVPVFDFSRDVLAKSPEMLSVLTVAGVEWEDLGDPTRVLETWRRRARADAPAIPASPEASPKSGS